MDVNPASFPAMSDAVKEAIEEGRAILLRVRRGDADAERFLLRVGDVELCVDTSGRSVDHVPVDVDQIVAEDVVTFIR